MTIPLSLRFDILARDGHRCRYCGKQAPETELEVDHIVPRSKGGPDDPFNLVTTCRDCNRGKGDKVIRPPLGGEWTTLAGKFFHELSPENGYIDKQGRILAAVGDRHLVIQYFDFVSGGPSWGCRLLPIEELASVRWILYRTDEEMREAYEYSGRRNPQLRP